MHLKKIFLHSFRNHCRQEFHFHPQLNIIVGNNGVGKTAILEAIYCLVLGRSPRAVVLREAIQWGQEAFSLQGVLENNQEEEETIKINVFSLPPTNEVKKEIFWQDKPLTNLTELWHRIGLVYFSGEEILLIKGEPQRRRQMLNFLLTQINSHYYFSYLRYQRSLRERNACLKRLAQGLAAENELSVWDEGLIKEGNYLIIQREKLIDSLSQSAGNFYPRISGGQERMAIQYRPSVKNDFHTELKNFREQEKILGTTLVGPHRDEVEFLLNGKSLKLFGSQGECRSAVLALKLAEVEIFKSVRGWRPLVLFDDVFSELDSRRQKFFLETLADGFQCFITITGNQPELLNPDKDFKKIFYLQPENVV